MPQQDQSKELHDTASADVHYPVHHSSPHAASTADLHSWKPSWNKLVLSNTGDNTRSAVRAMNSTEQKIQDVRTTRVLYVFSGIKREESMAECMSAIAKKISLSVEVHEWDIENGTEYDLTDDSKWNALLGRIKAEEFGAVFWSPPCSTFSHCRSDYDKGPRPLRGGQGKERYGRADVKLTESEKESLKLGTLLALRTAEGISVCNELGIGWLLENPPQRPGRPSLFGLDEIVEVCKDNVQRYVFPQCMFGALHEKWTEIRGTIVLRDVPQECTHPKVWWRLPPTGKWYHCGHPPMTGKILAVKAENWNDHMYNMLPERGAPYLSRASAHYPRDLNYFLAKALLNSAIERCRTSTKRKASSISSTPRFTQEKLRFSTRLKGQPALEQRDVDNQRAIGGLRCVSTAVKKVPGLEAKSRDVRVFLEGLLDRNPSIQHQVLRSIGSEDHNGIDPTTLQECRCKFGEFLGTPDVWPLFPSLMDCNIAAGLLEAWRCRVGDPESEVNKWLLAGAPGGLVLHPESCNIFPPSREDEDELGDPASLERLGESFASYDTVEEDDDAWTEVNRLASLGYLERFNDYSALCSWLGDEPVLSKFGMIVKNKNGVIKKRIILDGKQSKVTKCATKRERVILPRVLDVVHDALHMMADHSRWAASDWDLEFVVLDFTDAFWTLPLSIFERKFFVSRLRGVYFAYRRLAQGSRDAPLVWARVAALICRLVQALFYDYEVRMNTFVDDPNMCIAGNTSERNRCLTLIVLCWQMLNFDLAFKKGERGSAVNWIGASITANHHQVEATIKESTIQDLKVTLQEALQCNVIPIKKLRSIAGQLSNVAMLIVTWRPFLHQIWAALSAANHKSNSPVNTVWTRQVRSALLWFCAFLHDKQGAITRTFSLQEFSNVGDQIELVLDASPWALGGVLIVNGCYMSYFTSPIADHDERRFGIQRGRCEGQQVWEALCLLVALRVWASFWRSRRCVLSVKSDSVSALTLLLVMRPSTPQLAIIARELALDVSESCYRPVCVAHIPGVSNKLANMLSRAGEHVCIPPELMQAKRVTPPDRDDTYFRALAPPVRAKGA